MQYTVCSSCAGFEAQAGYAGEWDNYLARNWTGTKSFQYYRYEPYLLTQRYYDPSTGKFASRDPIGTQGGENLYGYAGDDPVNEADPSGEQETEPDIGDGLDSRPMLSNGAPDPNYDAEGREKLDFNGPEEEQKARQAAEFVRNLHLRILGDPMSAQFMRAEVLSQVEALNARYNCADLKCIVIGENMADVKASAKLYGAGYWRAWGVKGTGPGGQYTEAEAALVKARDVRWLTGQVRQGYTILDIGIDPNRSQRSEFYQAEEEALADLPAAKVVSAPRIMAPK